MKSDHSKQANHYKHQHDQVIDYLREKINQLLDVMGTLPLRTEELDDDTLISLDPIGILAESFKQVLNNQKRTNHQLELANEEINTIIDAAGAAIIVVDDELTIELHNKQSFNLLHSDITDCIGKNLYDCINHCKMNIPKDIFSQVKHEKKIQRRNDILIGEKYYDLMATPIMDRNENIIKMILMFIDNTDRNLTEDKLHLAATVFESTAEGVVVTDEKGIIVAVNDSLLKITGYKKEELIGKTPNIFKSGIHGDEFYKEIWHTINTIGHWDGELMDRRKDGQLFPVRQAISTVRREDGTISNYVSIMSDITTQRESQEKLDFLAHHDPLTSLPNRTLFQERLSQAIEKAKRHDDKLAIIFIDLDRFKNINDTLGHTVGDKLLIKLAEHLDLLRRSTDTVARLGGDEFIFLLQDINNAQSMAHYCEKLIDSLKKPFEIDNYSLHLTLSIGICIFPGDGEDVDSLIKNADTAMYRAKEKGKNCYQFFTQDLSEEVAEKLTLENDLRKAVEKNQFELFYQPQYLLSQDKLVSAEALIRWHHPELGLVPPDKFIPLAEETGIILQIGEWVIRDSCRQLKEWRDKGFKLDNIAINVSGLQITRGDLVTFIPSIMTQYGLHPNDLEIEITESTIMNDLEYAVDTLGKLKELGLTIAIDDFGTGYSSLGYLKKLPLDKLKIDRSFIKDIDSDNDDKALVLAIIAMARNLRLDVVAEGVEHKIHHDLLVEHNCKFAQGFLFSKPLPVDEFETLL